MSTFTLWHPIIDHDERGCSFDVRPYGFEGINQGNQVLLKRFLECLSIAALPKSWSINQFRSSYYAGAVADEWQARYPIAWRVQVKFPRSCNGMKKPRFFGPYSCDGADLTWKEQSYLQKQFKQPCVVIADFLDDQWETSQREFDKESVFRTYESVISAQLTSRITQVRFNMGEILFPNEEINVLSLIDICKSKASSVNWATTLLISQNLSQGENV